MPRCSAVQLQTGYRRMPDCFRNGSCLSDETPAVNSRSRTVSREFISESANFKIFFFYPISRNRRSQGFEHAFSKRSEWKTNFSNFCVIMEKLGEIRVEDDFSRRRSQILHDAHSVNDPLSGNA